jgi:MYXO-CTERM domain-containing protein
MACMSDRCLLASVQNTTLYHYSATALIFGAAGNEIAAFDITTSTSTNTPPVLTATDGSSFLIAGPGYLLPVAPGGTHGTPMVGGDPQVAALAGSGGVFLLGGAQANAAYRFDSNGNALGAPEPLPLAAPTGETIGAAWDGTAFFVAQGPYTGGEIGGMELSKAPFTPPDAGAADAGATTSVIASQLFAGQGPALVASDGAGNVLALSAQPSATYGVPRLVGRFAVAGVSESDAGPPGDSGAPLDSGAPGPGEAGLADGGPADAGAGPEAGTPGDAGDGADASVTPSADASASNGEAPGAGSSGGCGCTAAGSGSTSPLAWVAGFAALSLLAARTLRRRQ